MTEEELDARTDGRGPVTAMVIPARVGPAILEWVKTPECLKHWASLGKTDAAHAALVVAFAQGWLAHESPPNV